jgi:hypothetical protein
MRFWNGPTIPGSPEMDLSHGIKPDLERAFMAWHARTLYREATRVRVVTIYRAADFALGKDGAHWVMPHTFMPNAPRPLDRAAHSPVCAEELLEGDVGAELADVFPLAGADLGGVAHR